jgi:NADPH:quinone reductase-like Zn-dependent oxidoreductase
MISNPPAGQRLGVKTDGNMVGASPEVLAELARLIERGELELPITRTYPLGEVREAFRELEKRHLRGKIVLIP